jgi:protein O-GlcNAc transferase
MRFLCRALLSRLVGALLVSTLFAASLAASDDPRGRLKSADAAFHARYAAEQSGDLAAARKQFEKVVLLAPDMAEGHTALGSVLVQLGQYRPAIHELVRALTLKAGDRTAQINLAVAYEQLGDHEKSLALFRSLDRSAAPLPVTAVILYVRALAATRQTELAIAKTQSALAGAPENPALHDMLGSLEAQQEKWNDALSQFQEAVRLDPNFGEAHLHLGLALTMQQRPSEALNELRIAAELSPQSAFIQIEFAKALLAGGESTKAITVLQRALVLDPSSRDAKYQLALAFQGSGDEQHAIPFFQDVVAADPNDAPALTNLGLALVQTGKSKKPSRCTNARSKKRPRLRWCTKV